MHEQKRATPDYPIDKLIAARWSPYAFTDRPVSDDDLRSLLEAARWAPSSYNEQPWAYIVATKAYPEEFQRLLSCLVEGNQAWAKAAPVLAVGCSRLNFTRNGQPNAAAIHDLGLASANSIAAVVGGARQIECTINGIGERAGNCSLEEVVMAFRIRKDQLPYHTGINTQHLYPASKLLTEFIAFGPQPNKAIVGANAFAHEAGIHQDGYLKEKTTYEIIDPKSIGIPEGRLVLGKHSGRHALRSKCEHLGYNLSKEELDVVYQGFIEIADRKKNVADQEILAIIRTLKLSERMTKDAPVSGD